MSTGEEGAADAAGSTASARRPGEGAADAAVCRGPRTLPAQLLDWAGRTPGRTALRQKRRGVWEETTWAAYAADAAAIGLALQGLGLRPGDRLCLLAANRMEWLLADLGAQGVGAVTLGIDPTSAAPAVGNQMRTSRVRVVVCEDEEQLDKVLEVRLGVPSLVAAVVLESRGVHTQGDPLVHTWADLQTAGRTMDPSSWRRQVEALDPGAAAVLVLGDGALEVAGDALVAAAGDLISATQGDEVVSSSPLAGWGERVASIVQPLAVGATVSFVERGGSATRDLQEVQPTRRLDRADGWQDLHRDTERRLASASPLKRTVSRWCTTRGRAIAARRRAGAPRAGDPALGAVCRLVCFRPLRRHLGLARVTVALSTGGPPAPDALAWFEAIGVAVQACPDAPEPVAA